MASKFSYGFSIFTFTIILFCVLSIHMVPVSAGKSNLPPLPTLQAIEIEHSLNTLNTVTTILPYINNTLLISEQSGRIYLFTPPVLPDTLWSASLFLDLSHQTIPESELGFYSIALSPHFTTNHTLYLSYTNLDRDLVIERYNVITEARNIVLTVPKPNREDTDYHRAGQIEFYEGLLYISTGDNAIWEPYEFGHPSQDLNSLQGKILRIDVETGNPFTYTIPAGNPFIGLPNHRAEIWAYGLRNPYKFAFDAVTGDMLIADVGDSRYEEINLIPDGMSGLNFGWRCYEGESPFPFYDPACLNAVNTEAIHIYAHATVSGRSRCSIVGGRIYRGNQYTLFNGMYFFTDLCESRVRGVREENGIWIPYLVSELPGDSYPTVIGEDAQGTLYIGGITNRIYQLVDRPIWGNAPPIPKSIYLPFVRKN